MLRTDDTEKAAEISPAQLSLQLLRREVQCPNAEPSLFGTQMGQMRGGQAHTFTVLFNHSLDLT